MARLRQLSDLRNDAYKLADTEDATDRFPTTEVNYYINLGVAELYDLLVRSRSDFFESNVTIKTDGFNTVYALPADFYQMTLAQVNLGFSFSANQGDNNFPLFAFTMSERPELSASTPGWSGSPFSYRIHGGTNTQPGQTQGVLNNQYAIEFLPKPAFNISVQIFYIPTPPMLVNDNDQLDTVNSWDAYAVAMAAKYMRIKDDLPTAAMDQIMASIRERIEGIAPHRDAAGQRRVTDVRRRWNRYNTRKRRGIW